MMIEVRITVATGRWGLSGRGRWEGGGEGRVGNAIAPALREALKGTWVL